MILDQALLIALSLGVAGSIAVSEYRGAPHAHDIAGMATAIDGDTIVIHGTHIRLGGIDAPESAQTCVANGEKYLCGQAAAWTLAALIKGKTVTCHDSGERSYKRVVARCFINGVDLQAEMARQGQAIAYRRYSQDYVAAEDEAHAARRGIWAGTFVAPEVWRHSASARGE